MTRGLEDHPASNFSCFFHLHFMWNDDVRLHKLGAKRIPSRINPCFRKLQGTAGHEVHCSLVPAKGNHK